MTIFFVYMSFVFSMEVIQYNHTMMWKMNYYTVLLNISICYEKNFAKFYEMLKTKVMSLFHDKLEKLIYVIDAIIKFFAEKIEVEI